MRKQFKGESANDQLVGRLISALNHPVRRQILNALVQESASAKTLSDVFGLPLANVSYHLIRKLFKDCNVVRVVERNQRRGAEEKVFQIRPEVFVHAIDWPEIPEPFRSGLRGLALYDFQNSAIAALEAEGERPNVASVYKFSPALVDVQGQDEIGKAVETFASTVQAIEQRCASVDQTQLLNLIIGAAAFESAPLPAAANK